MRTWKRIGSERVADCRVFEVRRSRFLPDDSETAHDFFCVDSPDWITVIAVTPEDEVLFLRQYRYGVESVTLEVPGGMCDPDEAPLVAARRELLEETGYVSDDWTELGWVHPNPAVQSNRCFSFLARGARKKQEPTPDEHESFELVTLPRKEVSKAMAAGEITHSLVVAAFHLAAVTGRLEP